MESKTFLKVLSQWQKQSTEMLIWHTRLDSFTNPENNYDRRHNEAIRRVLKDRIEFGMVRVSDFGGIND